MNKLTLYLLLGLMSCSVWITGMWMEWPAVEHTGAVLVWLYAIMHFTTWLNG